MHTASHGYECVARTVLRIITKGTHSCNHRAMHHSRDQWGLKERPTCLGQKPRSHLLFFSTPCITHLSHQQILSALPSKYIQNSTCSHHLHRPVPLLRATVISSLDCCHSLLPVLLLCSCSPWSIVHTATGRVLLIWGSPHVTPCVTSPFVTLILHPSLHWCPLPSNLGVNCLTPFNSGLSLCFA